MRTIRGRLAVGYAIALATSMFVFAATIYFAQRPERYDQLDRRAEIETDLVADMIGEAYRRLGGPGLHRDGSDSAR